MGICISHAYSEIHDSPDCHENATILIDEKLAANEVQRLGSLCSKEGSKALNQDAAVLYQGYGIEGGAFCGVFDGHGKNGHVVSKIVRNRLPSLLLNQKNAIRKITKAIDDDGSQCYSKKRRTKSVPTENFYKWREACVTAFKVMDKEIVKLHERLDCSCSGTTAVVVIRQGEDLVIANLGDSRAVLGTLTEKGLKAVQLTTDLKPSLPSEAERIRKCNGRVIALKEEPHTQRVWLPNANSPGLAMSRAFGDFLLKNHGVTAIPEIYYHRLTPSDQFTVLVTDGVWDVLSNNQVAEIVYSANSEQAAAEAVVEAATATWKKKFPLSRVDDCTAVCLFFQKKQKVILAGT